MLCLVALQARAQDTMSLSLQQALEYGLQNAVSVKEAQLSIADAEARKREAISRGYPQVNASISYSLKHGVWMECHHLCQTAHSAKLLMLF